MNTLVSESARDSYLIGVRAFEASENDNPDCVPFYRAWFAMTQVIGKDAMSRWHHLLHECLCWASSQPESEQFNVALKHARYMIDRWSTPDEPRYIYSGQAHPSEPTETDARKFFNEEFKRAFPGKRANSREANRLWEEKREQAMAILRERYQASVKEYETHEQDIETKNAAMREAWIDRFRGMAEWEQFVRNLETHA
jgi:hypothetical protein